MKNDFKETLSQKTILFDGGIGTMLQAEGLAIGDAPEKWNVDKPNIIAQVHQYYVKAGCDCVTTNTFGGSPHKLIQAKITQSAYDINKISAQIAKESVEDKAWVAGSIGPTGALLLMGDLSEDDMLSGFSEQVRGLRDGGADLIIIETMSDLTEIELAIKAVKNESDLPVIASMTFEKGKNGYRTIMGVTIPSAVDTLSQLDIDVIGTNCGAGIDRAIEIVHEMKPLTDLPILAEPNAGLPKLVEGKTIYEETPDAMSEFLPKLLDAGAQIIGGCCGTTPEHIVKFRQVLNTR